MRLLLDTHALLWWLADDPTLGAEARAAIAAETTDVWVSAASAWEMSIKSARGKLRTRTDLEAELDVQGFAELPIRISHALRAGALPPHHRDPFDRMLVAQAQVEGLTIVTRDPNVALYEVATLAA